MKTPKLNHVFIDKPALSEIGDWIAYCKQYGFRKVYLRFAALQGLYVSAYPPGELEAMIAAFKIAGITVGLHCFSHLIEPTIDSLDLAHDAKDKPLVLRMYYTPRVGTELFYTIARSLGEFYSKMRFNGGIYFDGIDYLNQITKYTDVWNTSFIARTLRYVETYDCTVECACPGLTNARYLTCVTAEDQPHENFREWVDGHVKRNAEKIASYYPKEYINNLGWLSLNELPEIEDLVYFLKVVRNQNAIYGCVRPSLKMDAETRQKMAVLGLFNSEN